MPNCGGSSADSCFSSRPSPTSIVQRSGVQKRTHPQAHSGRRCAKSPPYNQHYSTRHLLHCSLRPGISGLRKYHRPHRRQKGLALSIVVWSVASISHASHGRSWVFGIARFALGLGESGTLPRRPQGHGRLVPCRRERWRPVYSTPEPAPPPGCAFHHSLGGDSIRSGGVLHHRRPEPPWLAAWLLFPYDRAQNLFGATATHASAVAPRASFASLLHDRKTWSFALSKALTDPVWWFYLFWLPKFFHERFQVDMQQLGLPLVLVYVGRPSEASAAAGWPATPFAAVARRAPDADSPCWFVRLQPPRWSWFLSRRFFGRLSLCCAWQPGHTRDGRPTCSRHRQTCFLPTQWAPWSVSEARWAPSAAPSSPPRSASSGPIIRCSSFCGGICLSHYAGHLPVED